ncbi:TPA: hypothetical protein EYQ19_02200 [Candidatus Pacearchaeota archaeon]|nr:hypothetical protein [Candidatus Pacearchaeota archaeon]
MNADELVENYNFLKEIGFTNRVIAKQTQLLCEDPETISRNYVQLSEFGMSDSYIVNDKAYLLGKNPENISRNFVQLKEIGFTDFMITMGGDLLGKNPETLGRNIDKLKEFGFRDRDIEKRYYLLRKNPATLGRNIDKLKEIGLGDDYFSRLWDSREFFYGKNFKGKEARKDSIIFEQSQLLMENPETLGRNIDKLKEIGFTNRDIAKQYRLLGWNPETISRNIDKLKGLGVEYSMIAPDAQDSFLWNVMSST